MLPNHIFYILLSRFSSLLEENNYVTKVLNIDTLLVEGQFKNIVRSQISVTSRQSNYQLWSTVGPKILQIWHIMCQKVLSHGGLDSDHRSPTEHEGTRGTEFSGVPVAQLVKHRP